MGTQGKTWVRKRIGHSNGYRIGSLLRTTIGLPPEMYKTIAKHSKQNKLTMAEQIRRYCSLALEWRSS